VDIYRPAKFSYDPSRGFFSRTRTVVRECCKGDDASQWENGKFEPLPPPNPLTDRHKKLNTWLPHGYLPTCKIYSRSLKGFLFPVCAKLRIKMFTRILFFRVLPTSYSLDAWTDFHAQYVKRRGSAQGCAFSGSEDKHLTFNIKSRKSAIFGPDFDGTWKIFYRKPLYNGDTPM